MIDVRLREIRKYKRLTQDDFAKKIGLKQGSIADWERGKSSPSIDTLVIIANSFNINLHWLLTGQGEMFLGQTPQTSEFQANNNELEKQQKRLQDLQKQVDLLKKNIQEIDIEYDQEKKRSSDLIHENQKLNRELLTLMRDLIDCKNLVIKLQQK